MIYELQNLLFKLGFYAQKSADLKAARSTVAMMRPLAISEELVRIGGASDGGYLLPKSVVDSCEAVFSPGVAETADFESYFLERGIPCYMIDGSVLAPPISHDLAKFEKLWLGTESQNGESISLKDWTEYAPRSKEFILQIDIEGAEYEVIIDTPEDVLEKFSAIVIELHDLHSLALRSGVRLVSSTIRKLLRTHTVVHFHANNTAGLLGSSTRGIPDVVELTLIRNDRWTGSGDYAHLPHPLDSPNVPSKPQVNYNFQD